MPFPKRRDYEHEHEWLAAVQKRLREAYPGTDNQLKRIAAWRSIDARDQRHRSD